MLEFPRWKIVMVLLVCLAGFWYALPNVLGEKTREQFSAVLPPNTMNLGLDLRGGSYLLLEVNFHAYLADQMQGVEDDIRKRLRDAKVGYQGLSATRDSVKFNLRSTEDEAPVRDALKGLFREMEFALQGTVAELRYREDTIKDLKVRVLEQSIEIIRRRVDETGTREPVIQRQGDSRILLQVPGLEDPEQLKRLMGETAKLTFHLMNGSNPYPMEAARAPAGEELLRDKEGRFYLVKKRVELGGDMLVDAQAGFDRGEAIINFRFNTQGGRKFADITRQNVGKPFAIVLDGKVVTAPTIREPILSGSGQISGSFTVQSANETALLLRAGALPAPINVVEERSVGPSLGADSIVSGEKAAVVAALFVIGMMVLCYGRFGIYASFAMGISMVLIIAVLSLFQATLTMPGIAGMVLTMGMAVDANVLIFERIREESRIGRSPFAAVDMGFRQAWGTILDSNLTTVIAALLLFLFGSGPVKGFAVTLSVGVLCSMFTAILLTRMIIVLWLKKDRPKALNV